MNNNKTIKYYGPNGVQNKRNKPGTGNKQERQDHALLRDRQEYTADKHADGRFDFVKRLLFK